MTESSHARRRTAPLADHLRGLISPAEFIPVAEQSGLILDLGQRVLQVACAQLGNWSAHQRRESALLGA